MNPITQITIQSVKINSIDRLGHLSVSSTMQIGKHVSNKRVEGFGEQNGDISVFHSLKSFVDDADFVDSDSEKRG
jgi:hypothetical protein